MPAVKTVQKSTVRLRAEAYDTLEKMVAQVTRFGWAALGRSTDETATMEAVAAFAIMELAARTKNRSKK